MRTYSNVTAEEFLTIGLGQRDRVGDLGAVGVAAEVAVPDSGVTGRVDV